MHTDRYAQFLAQLTGRTAGGRTRLAASGLQTGAVFLVCVIVAQHAARGDVPKTFVIALECGLSERAVRYALKRARAAGVYPHTLTIGEPRQPLATTGKRLPQSPRPA